MTPIVTISVLAAALCHAAWNAMIRTRGDKIVSMTLVVAGSGLLAAPGLLVVGVPRAAAWPFLVASVMIHFGYTTCLALAYQHGELSKVYPLVRGFAPLLTLVASLAFLHEGLEASGIAGILLLATGIMTLALDGGWRSLRAAPRGLAYAAVTTICIAAYTVSDGMGARAAGDPHAYVVWLFALNGLPMLLAVLALKRGAFISAARTDWPKGLVGGALSVVAYWIVIWAFTVAPIPLVAALRETSILFAALIGVIVLRERVTPVRAASIALVLAGLVLMRL